MKLAASEIDFQYQCRRLVTIHNQNHSQTFALQFSRCRPDVWKSHVYWRCPPT
jgi:hypothetical protein